MRCPDIVANFLTATVQIQPVFVLLSVMWVIPHLDAIIDGLVSSFVNRIVKVERMTYTARLARVL
jgi:hypothetical protein